MYSIRKWMFKPKRTDTSLLAQFFYADDELNMVASELDSFDGRKDPSRCAALVNQLRQCQDKVLNIIGTIMEDAIPDHRSSRDFRVKFPDDVLQESLAGQLWFGAECLAAGSSIMNREVESASMRPLAKALTRHLDYLRSLLRDQCLKNLNSYTDRIKDALVLFDRLFAEFELSPSGLANISSKEKDILILERYEILYHLCTDSYVSAMVPVKSMKEYDVLQDVIVLFSETTQRALKLQLLTQDMIDDYDPALMFTIPRLAMCCGLLIYPEGPLNPDMDPVNMSEMFRPFQTLLYKIRELLWTLSKEELWMLEKALCSAEEPGLYRDAEPLSFDDAAASYPDDYISALAEHAEFSVEPEFLYDANGNCHASTVHHLQAEGSDCAYGRMSQSPSAVTIVANPNYKSKSAEESEGTSLKEEREVEEEVEEGENDDGKHLNLKGATMGSITHQDSADSGMLSENGSISETTPPDLSTLFESMGHDTRTLRHSLSWPSPTRRARGHRQFSDGDAAAAESADILDEEEDALRAICTHHSSTHEFNFHLPLNTQMTSSAQFEEGEIPHISVEAVNTPSSSNSVGPFQRIFFTSDCHEESSDNGPQISFFTDTLNEVFVTDRSFQAADISKGQSSSKVGKLCSKCGKIKSSKLKNMKPKSVDSDAICDIKEDIENSKKSNMNTVSDEMESLEESWEEKANKENLEKDLLKQRDCSANERENSERLEESDSESSPLIDSCDESESKSATSSSIGCDDVVNPDCDRSEAEMASSDKCECDSSAEPDTFCGSTNTEDTQAVKVKANRVCENQEMAHRNTLEVPRVQRVKYHVEPGHWPTFSPSHSMGSVECDWDRESYASTDTSSYNSDCHDDEEIALAIQAAELAARKEARSRFKSSSDLIHRLFVCISGVADQLQTNYASDLRHILKCVFECNASEPFIPIDNSKIDGEGLHDMGLQGPSQGEATEDRDSISSQEDREEPTTSEDTQQVAPPVATMSPRSRTFEEPPPWVPDEQCPYCTSCKVIFTFVRRRHHCRNCGKVFCGRCSSNSVPLPHYGHSKPVRVCNHCFMFQVTPFTVDE